MKIIFLRGLPGSGKTKLANRLAEQLSAEVLHVDELKVEAKKNLELWPEARQKAYNQTLDYFTDAKNRGVDIVICEELMADTEFVKRLETFCRENQIEAFWYRIDREMTKLLELENSPERVNRSPKNSEEDFKRLSREIEGIVVPGEIVINNNDTLDIALSEIKKQLELQIPSELIRVFKIR